MLVAGAPSPSAASKVVFPAVVANGRVNDWTITWAIQCQACGADHRIHVCLRHVLIIQMDLASMPLQKSHSTNIFSARDSNSGQHQELPFPTTG